VLINLLENKNENFTSWGLKVIADIFLRILFPLLKISQLLAVLIIKLMFKKKQLLLFECIF